MSDDQTQAPRRLLSVADAADYLGTSRSALLADEKRAPHHPQSFRLPLRRRVVFDREELDAYIERFKAEHRGEPLPPTPLNARQSFMQEQIAAWCAKQVMVPVEPNSFPAKAAALNEALRMKQDVTVEVRFQDQEIERREYRWQSDGRCEVVVHRPKAGRLGRLPKWARAALRLDRAALTEAES